MRWTPQKALANMAGRPSDLTAAEQAARVQACASCSRRVAGDCLPAGQMISVHALRRRNRCPLGKWEGGTRRRSEGANPLVARSPSRPVVYPQADHRQIERIAAVTCHFNPCGYRRIESNYHRFLAALPEGLPLWTIELAFDDDPFRLPAGPRMIQIRGEKHRHLLWQKERLLNLAIAKLPAEYDAVAWLDADLLWLNPDWLSQALDCLARYRVVQLFEGVSDTDKSGRVLATRPGYVKARRDGFSYGRPGGAWAARRDALPAWQYDRHIIGGGDSAMVHAWEESDTLPVSLSFGPEWLADFERWAARASIGRSLSCVPGDVLHLYHGTRERRAYVERYDILHEFHYDPQKDLDVDPDTGLLEWSDSAKENKPGMLQRVADYFEKRREDD